MPSVLAAGAGRGRAGQRQQPPALHHGRASTTGPSSSPTASCTGGRCPKFMRDGSAFRPRRSARSAGPTCSCSPSSSSRWSEARSPPRVRSCPAGLPALLSFAELLRRAAKAYLDIDEDELEVGLQPWRAGESRLLQGLHRRRHGQRGRLRRWSWAAVTRSHALLRGAGGHGAAAARAAPRGECTSSCPGCLRNYENRFTHWALDWRLALDVVDLALGEELQHAHWSTEPTS